MAAMVTSALLPRNSKPALAVSTGSYAVTVTPTRVVHHSALLLHVSGGCHNVRLIMCSFSFRITYVLTKYKCSQRMETFSLSPSVHHIYKYFLQL